MNVKTKKMLGVILVAILLLTAFAFTNPGKDKHVNVRIVEAPDSVVWNVISDVANYHQYADGLTDLNIISGSGEGMVRSCATTDGLWTETCTLWKPGEQYTFVVDTQADDYPFPFKELEANWLVEKVDERSSRIVLTFQYRFNYRWMQWGFASATHKHLDKGNKVLLDNWAEEIRTRMINYIK